MRALWELIRDMMSAMERNNVVVHPQFERGIVSFFHTRVDVTSQVMLTMFFQNAPQYSFAHLLNIIRHRRDNIQPYELQNVAGAFGQEQVPRRWRVFTYPRCGNAH